MAFFETLKALPMQKKLIAAGGIGALVLAMTFLVQMAMRPPMALLYAGIDTAAAGEIVSVLDGEGVPYRIEGERIYVAAPERDRLRLSLANQGLPRQSVAGYELLENMSGFSTTADMFTAAYWRAKEGELTRTILTMPGIQAARVHIGADDRSPFSRNQTPRTASVTVTAPSGLSSAQIKAIQHITALAVSGLRPEMVAVADSRMGLLTNGEEDPTMTASLDEDRRARALERELTQLIEARVGSGNARVSVALQLSREREAFTEQSVDPASAVVTSRVRSESTESEQGVERAVTIASDLPDGDAAPEESSLERSETREELAYALSTIDRRVERMPGTVERLTVAVLLDHMTVETEVPSEVEGEPAQVVTNTVPRPADEIEALRALIETAAGVDPARGDRVTIQSLPFTRGADDGLMMADAAAESPLAGMESYLWQAGQVVFLGIVALILGLFVVKPILAPGAVGGDDAVAALTAEATPLIEDPVTMLRTASADAPDAAAALLNAWLDEEEENIA